MPMYLCSVVWENKRLRSTMNTKFANEKYTHIHPFYGLYVGSATATVQEYRSDPSGAVVSNVN